MSAYKNRHEHNWTQDGQGKDDGTEIGQGTARARREMTPPPSYESIAKRSYELYLARGAQPGHEVEDWLAAEAELTAKLH